MISHFIVLRWLVGSSGDPERIVAHLRTGMPADWVTIEDTAGFFVAVSSGATARVRRLVGGGYAFGQMFDRQATDLGIVRASDIANWTATDPLELGRTVMSRAWGAYVVVAPVEDARTGSIAIIRDPLGALDCFFWRTSGLCIVVSSLSPSLVALLRPPRGLDWNRIAALVALPTDAGEALGFAAVHAVTPGTLTILSADTIEEIMLWTPADFCAPHCPPGQAIALAGIVDACVAAWAGCYDVVVAEVSGGLDSAIVTASLQAMVTPPLMHGLNYFADDAQGDERDYARAIAAQLHLPLTEVARRGTALVAADLFDISGGARPSINAFDVHYDADLERRAAALNAGAIFTGQGGDALFFQMPTALVGAEALVPGTSLRDVAGAMIAAAGWTRSTVWSTVATAATARWQPLRSPQPPSVLMHRDCRIAPTLHRWLDATADLTPAKRLQIWGLANSRIFFGESRRSRAADVVHPLMSQPLVECVLSLSVRTLTGGDQDRRLARSAFTGRLPEVSLRRHGKGDLTAFYGRMIARSTGFLREHLCGGVLAAHQVIDRDLLAARLDPERLAVDDAYTEIITAALIESWVRAWQ